jgi:hypothetical protein
MQAHTDALVVEGSGEPRDDSRKRYQPTIRCDAPKLDVIGQDAYPLHRHEEAGIGAVVVAGIWFVFYVIAIVRSLAVGS